MLAELIRANQPCVVLTGAGVSTESGIPDFRSAEGIWAQLRPMMSSPASTASARARNACGSSTACASTCFARPRPNPAHLAIAELERRGLVQAVITQNVDRLHAAAGSRDVIEVHGSIGSAVCLSCGHCEEDVRPLLPLPRCAHCGAVLKPGVVMFGELLPVDAIDRAQALAESAELLLVVGTSLEVWPVAGLPGATLEHGGRLVIVNRDPTPYDRRAELVVHGSAGEVLAACVRTMSSS